VQANEIPPNVCWECGGPTMYPGSRCPLCKYKLLPPPRQRQREKRFNQEAAHGGKTGMLAAFAIMRERLRGATPAEAVDLVRDRFPSIDWDEVKVKRRRK